MVNKIYRKVKITEKIGDKTPFVSFCTFGSVYVHQYVKNSLGLYVFWEKIEWGNIKNIEFLN